VIPTKERNEIIELLINKLSSSDTEFPYDEIRKKYNIKESTLIAEILRELSDQDIIKESGNTFHSGKLLSKGLEIKRNGGWLKALELDKSDEERKRTRDEAELENLRYSTKLSKIQIRWFNISLLIGFIGGLSGILALVLELQDQRPKDNQKQNSVEKVDTLKLSADTLSITDMNRDSLKSMGTKTRANTVFK